jgi:hypothetical protein
MRYPQATRSKHHPAAATLGCVPQTSIVRLATEAPRIGADYEFEHGRRRFRGLVVAHKALGKAKLHVHVIVKLSEPEHTRLILGDGLAVRPAAE